MKHLCLLLAMMAGCAAPSAGPFNPASVDTASTDAYRHEVRANPRILLDASVPANALSYRGIRIGDPVSRIDARWIEQQVNDWVLCNDGSRFGTRNGAVVTLGVWDTSTVAALRITSIDEISAILGEPTRIDHATIGAEQIRVYRYDALDRRFVWNESAGKLLAINIGATGAADR